MFCSVPLNKDTMHPCFFVEGGTLFASTLFPYSFTPMNNSDFMVSLGSIYKTKHIFNVALHAESDGVISFSCSRIV